MTLYFGVNRCIFNEKKMKPNRKSILTYWNQFLIFICKERNSQKSHHAGNISPLFKFPLMLNLNRV